MRCVERLVRGGRCVSSQDCLCVRALGGQLMTGGVEDVSIAAVVPASACNNETRPLRLLANSRISLLVVVITLVPSLYAAPKISSLSPTSGNVGTSVAISGS